MSSRKRYQIATLSRTLFVRVVRTGHVLAGGRRDVFLGAPDSAGSWSSRARAEEVLTQACAVYPRSGLEIVEVRS